LAAASPTIDAIPLKLNSKEFFQLCKLFASLVLRVFSKCSCSGVLSESGEQRDRARASAFD
jgi:hypothetical protein